MNDPHSQDPAAYETNRELVEAGWYDFDIADAEEDIADAERDRDEAFETVERLEYVKEIGDNDGASWDDPVNREFAEIIAVAEKDLATAEENLAIAQANLATAEENLATADEAWETSPSNLEDPDIAKLAAAESATFAAEEAAIDADRQVENAEKAAREARATQAAAEDAVFPGRSTQVGDIDESPFDGSPF